MPTYNPTPEQKQAFIDNVLPMAQKAATRYGVPVAITLGQAALASDWGTNSLAVKGNNLFARPQWGNRGFTPDDRPDKSYTRYPSLEASVMHNADSIANLKTLAPAREHDRDDYKGWVAAMGESGYLKNVSNISAKDLERVIRDNGFNKYDNPLAQTQEAEKTASRGQDAQSKLVNPQDIFDNLTTQQADKGLSR